VCELLSVPDSLEVAEGVRELLGEADCVMLGEEDSDDDTDCDGD